MDAEAARYLGAGLALLCIFGVGLGLGQVFSAYITATARNPAAEAKFKGMTYIGFAVIEALGIFALVVALLLVFGG
jgi:F0F1-type ATP synthase membrane subunit c/vacuolar-type H+-ATPase subunit K